MSDVGTDGVRVLLVGDDSAVADTETILKREDDSFDIETATDASAGLERIHSASVDCVVSDYDLPDRDGVDIPNGVDLLEHVRGADSDLPFILYTDAGSEAVASEAVSAGVTEYVRKGSDRDRDALAHAVRNAVEHAVGRSPEENQQGADRDGTVQHARRMETLISNLPGFVYRCRNAPGWPMEFVKGESRSITGYTTDELASQDVAWGTDVLHPEDRDRIWETVQEAIERDEEFEVTYRIRAKDGTIRWMWERGQLVDPTVEGRAVLEGFITDVTERKRYEQELERRNRELERFTSIVSHDLRNPLNVAQSRVELAREERESEHLDKAVGAHERMEALIDDLLTLARSGKRITETEWVALSTVVERAWRNVATREVTLSMSLDRTMEADSGRLTQLFENLIRNAVEHGGDGVTVTVGEFDGGFYVEDSGSGIPEDRRENVFDAGHSTADDGTGFGLVIVEQIAEAHGWTVEAVEGADGGARIEVTGLF